MLTDKQIESIAYKMNVPIIVKNSADLIPAFARAIEKAVREDTREPVSDSLRKAFDLGQTYWRQADSESYKENAKAERTRARFLQLVIDTCAALEMPESIMHGLTCEKVAHKGSGYLHSADDDTPYDVDGAMYCGRCHYMI